MGSKEDIKIALETFLKEVMKDWGKSIKKLLVKEVPVDRTKTED